MKTLAIFSLFLCVALSIGAPTAETAVVQQEDKPAPKPEVDGDTAVVAPRAVASRQVRFSFCPNGWQSFRGLCYYLENNPASWIHAESDCASYGGSLASVHNIWEYTFLQRIVGTADHTFAWIGGYYFQGDWRWEDGSLFDYHNWQSLASTYQYQCLQLNSEESQGWSNHGCTMHFPYICQVNPNC